MNYSEVKILVIDDEKMILEMLRRMLTKIGFTVDVTESAEEGIKKLHNNPYDLILTDIKMPEMSGNDFFNYVKNDLEQSTPITAMSGTPWLLENSDFDDVIAKPFCKEELFNVVSQFVQIA